MDRWTTGLNDRRRNTLTGVRRRDSAAALRKNSRNQIVQNIPGDVGQPEVPAAVSI